MLLSLDHVPFYAGSDIALRSFRELGFKPSPLGAYTSSEFPKARWPTNCVFLERGWFDLLRDTGLSPDKAAIPGGCLFLTDNLEGATKKIADVAVTARYSLERKWDNVDGSGERFELVSYKESLCQLPVAIIAHHWPCDDLDPDWTKHPNGALSLEGVVCLASGKQKVMPDKFSKVLDASQAMDLATEDFHHRFDTKDVGIAVSVRVRDLDAVGRLLEKSAVTKTMRNNTLLAFPAGLGCVFEFTA